MKIVGEYFNPGCLKIFQKQGSTLQLYRSHLPLTLSLCDFAAHFRGLQHLFNQLCSLLLVARELYFNAKLYTDHEALSETSRYNPKFAQDGLFLIALPVTQRGDQRHTASPIK